MKLLVHHPTQSHWVRPFGRPFGFVDERRKRNNSLFSISTKKGEGGRANRHSFQSFLFVFVASLRTQKPASPHFLYFNVGRRKPFAQYVRRKQRLLGRYIPTAGNRENITHTLCLRCKRCSILLSSSLACCYYL